MSDWVGRGKLFEDVGDEFYAYGVGAMAWCRFDGLRALLVLCPGPERRAEERLVVSGHVLMARRRKLVDAWRQAGLGWRRRRANHVRLGAAAQRRDGR